MDGRMFDGLIQGMLVIGIVIGVVLCGLAWLAWWLWQRVSISWVS